MSEREWKNIAGYEGKYIISNDGLVVSLPRKALGWHLRIAR